MIYRVPVHRGKRTFLIGIFTRENKAGLRETRGRFRRLNNYENITFIRTAEQSETIVKVFLLKNLHFYTVAGTWVMVVLRNKRRETTKMVSL
jgi:hypothetical protein